MEYRFRKVIYEICGCLKSDGLVSERHGVIVLVQFRQYSGGDAQLFPQVLVCKEGI